MPQYVHICRVLSLVAVSRSRSVLSCEDILILWQTDTQSAAAVKLSAAGEIYWAGRTHRIVCRVTRYKRVTVTLLSRTHNSDGAQHHVTVLALTPPQSVNLSILAVSNGSNEILKLILDEHNMFDLTSTLHHHFTLIPAIPARNDKGLSIESMN